MRIISLNAIRRANRRKMEVLRPRRPRGRRGKRLDLMSNREVGRRLDYKSLI